MEVGIITGSGTYALPELVGSAEQVRTEWGTTDVTRGELAGVRVAHVSRHGEGHVRLSNHVTHRANVGALAQLGVDAAIAVTVCGAVDPGVALGSLICFDDLHFPANRLPDGSLCTFYGVPGDAPRFNTKAEIRGLAAAGVTAVSQTAGPEAVLAGEAELPFALVGYATDYANGVQVEATPVARLLELIAASTETFARVLASALPLIDTSALTPAGIVYRFHEE